jgi:hypothetical protein
MANSENVSRGFNEDDLSCSSTAPDESPVLVVNFKTENLPGSHSPVLLPAGFHLAGRPFMNVLVLMLCSVKHKTFKF